jgi:hypothetical protein
MRRAAVNLDPDSQNPFRGVHHAQIGRLECDREVGSKSSFHQCLRAEAPLLFARGGGQNPADVI